VFDDHEEFAARAVEFLREGLDRGVRVVYVAEGDPGSLCADLAPLGDIEALASGGVLSVRSVGDIYPAGTVVRPSEQVARYREATLAAVDNGFQGLRVAAHATSLAASREQREAFACYECLVDDLMASLPFSAMCGYDRSVVGDAGANELACVHPLAGGHEAPFHLFTTGGGVLSLRGEVDFTAEELLGWALSRSPTPRADVVHLDVGGLTFIDHHGLVALDKHSRTARVVTVLQHASPTVGRVVDILGLDSLRVEAAA
jgi:anti-anti-sigma regulatory factor